jgi:RNA polymerase sigma-70 factor (ECF subfamily)
MLPVFLALVEESSGAAHDMAMDDADLRDVADSRQGDGEAYRRLVRRHQAAIARRMRRFACHAADVEDLVQEVFVQAYFSLGKFSARAPFEHWLNRIATRVGYRAWKRQRSTRPSVTLDDRLAPSAPQAQGNEAAEILQQVLWQLSPRDRLVLTLLYLEDRSIAEAAQLVGWSRTMVKVQAFRARARLRKLLERRGLVEVLP